MGASTCGNNWGHNGNIVEGVGGTRWGQKQGEIVWLSSWAFLVPSFCFFIFIFKWFNEVDLSAEVDLQKACRPLFLLVPCPLCHDLTEEATENRSTDSWLSFIGHFLLSPDTSSHRTLFHIGHFFTSDTSSHGTLFHIGHRFKPQVSKKGKDVLVPIWMWLQETSFHCQSINHGEFNKSVTRGFHYFSSETWVPEWMEIPIPQGTLAH